MIERRLPAGFLKAREFAARVKSPVGKPFAAEKKKTGPGLLYIYDAIGKDPWSGEGIDANDVVKALAEMEGDSLEVHINSPGGYVFDGIAIFNAIRAFKGTKTVHVDGIAASIASVIALAGDKVITNEGATWMIHEPASGIYSFGNADEIEDDARRTVQALRKIRENILDIYVTATGQKLSDLSAWMAAETWMTAAEAKARGFTDEVVRQTAAEPEDKAAAPAAARAAAMNAADVAALARIKRRELANKFAGASPVAPGQPGTTAAPAMKGTTP
jgi:ATP-dependent protease ClpP protease subunit